MCSATAVFCWNRRNLKKGANTFHSRVTFMNSSSLINWKLFGRTPLSGSNRKKLSRSSIKMRQEFILHKFIRYVFGDVSKYLSFSQLLVWKQISQLALLLTSRPGSCSLREHWGRTHLPWFRSFLGYYTSAIHIYLFIPSLSFGSRTRPSFWQL